MNFDSIKEILGDKWLQGALTLLVCCMFMYAAKTVLLRHWSKKASDSSGIRLGNIMRSLNFPLNLFIIFAGLAVSIQVMPFNARTLQYLETTNKALLLFVGIVFVDRLIGVLLKRYDAKIPSAKLTQGIIMGLLRTVVYLIGAMMVLDSMGVSISPVLASLGVGSLAVALALQGTIANFFSGLFMTVEKNIRVNDFIKLESGIEGVVEDIGWRSTRVKLLSNNIVIIPNAKLIDSIITNYQSPEPETLVTVQCGIHYDSDLDKVEKTAVEVAVGVMNEHEFGVSNFEPALLYHEFGDSSINFVVYMRATEARGRLRIAHEFIKRLHARFAEEGIRIPYPIRTVELAGGRERQPQSPPAVET